MKINLRATFTAYVPLRVLATPLRGTLSNRTSNALYDYGVDYFGDLVQLSSSQLSRMKGMGKGARTEIATLVASRGVAQGSQLDDWELHRPTARERRLRTS